MPGEPFPVYTPTPTQEENDRAVAGDPILDHEPDGSPEDPNALSQSAKKEEKHVEAAKPKPASGTYQTRTMRAAPAGQPSPPPSIPQGTPTT